MVRENLQILLELYYRPLKALSSVLDRGSVLFALVAAILTNVALGIVLANGASRAVPVQQPRPPISADAPAQEQPAAPAQRFVQPFLFSPTSAVAVLAPLALFFVPAAVIIVALWDGLGGVGVQLRSNYMPMLACALMTWTAAYAPVALIAAAALGSGSWPPQTALIAVAAGQVAFLCFSVCSIRTVMGASWSHAIGTVLGAAIAMMFGQFAYSAVGNFSYIFASPFVLFYGYMLLQQDIRLLGGGLSSRQSLRRHLEASTLNPRDSDAHYQLGLIYQQRRAYPEAIARFEKAVEIEPTEADAHYQLGRIAREQKRFADARKHFVAALDADPKHSSGEVWRDLGATDFELGHLEQALSVLEQYLDRRSYDPEGLYFLGMTLKSLGRSRDARDAFERSSEAARTAPSHLRRKTSKWGGLARTELRTLPKP